MKGKIEKLGKVSITVEKDYWDKNKAYNRLTIVERQGTRTAYLSRKAVPIGVDITDRNYWITISKWADIPYEIVQEFGDSPELVISQKVVTLKVNELQGLIDDINDIIGEGGSIDERITTAKLEIKSELIDGASENTNTFKKVEDALNERYTKEETYSKEELNNLITTPNQKYVTVEEYTSLPESGEADTTYRVSNWDGSLTTPAVDITKYSEYAWNGTRYIFLSVKSQIGEVYDISANNSGMTYVDLAAALGTNGTNVPANVRKGGMSIKFIQSSDNKYIRYEYKNVSVNESTFSQTENWVNIKNDSINVLNDKIYGTNLYLDVNNSSFPSSGITSQNMMLSFIKDFKMLVEREEGYEYGIMKVNNGLPSEVNYAYFIGLYKWAEGSTPTVEDVIASYSVKSNPANGKIYLSNPSQSSILLAEVVVDWSALTEQFGDRYLYSGVGSGVKYNQQYIFDNSAHNGILSDIKSLQEESSKIPNLEERIEDVEKQIMPEQIVYKKDSQDITNCSKGYDAKGQSVLCTNAVGSKFDAVDIPFSAKSGTIDATLMIGQTDSTGESGVRNALSQQNLLIEKAIQLKDDVSYKRIILGENIEITKSNIVIAVTSSSDISAVYHVSHDGMAGINGFFLTNNWYNYAGSAAKYAYGAYPRLVKSAGDVIQRLDNLEEEVDALEEILEDIGIYLPDTLYAVVGDTLQLFHRAIIKVPNPSVYDVQILCSKGKDYPRYFEYTPTISDVGQTTLTIYVKNSNCKVLAQKSCMLITVNVVSSPSSAKKVLCFGDSLTVAGTWCAEAYRRLTGSGGTPEGKNLSNIAFCGSMTKNGAGYFGVGGWTWGSYITQGSGNYYRFQVSSVNTLNIDAVYTNNGNIFTIKEVNVTEGSGNILCAVSSLTPEPSASGTLTKQSGNGDATIAYSSVAEDSRNPLWDVSQNKMSFVPYANEVSNGNIDVVYVLLGWNQITPAQTNFTSLINQVKTFADTLHSEFPSAKLKIVGLQINSLTGGMAANYGASGGYSDEWGIAIAAWNLNKAYIDFTNSVDYSGFVEYVDIASQFDTEYNMPYTNKDVNTRNSDNKELVGTNGVHPSTSGYYQIADSIYRNAIKELCQ